MSQQPHLRDRYGRVAVVMGGDSAEREVSLRSGTAVLAALLRSGVDAVAIDSGSDPLAAIRASGCDRLFIALHGGGGEDGRLQGALDLLQIPYTGSGVLASALGMNKLATKRVWQGAGLPTPPFICCDSTTDEEEIIAATALPLIVKPLCEGSSIGMSRVERRDELAAAIAAAARYGAVMAERWIRGREYTVALLNGAALPPIRLETPHSFYDYAAKYHANTTRYHLPCGLDSLQEAGICRLAEQAASVIGVTGWGRVDLLIDGDDQPWLIEINTVPGMTDHSLVPMAARAAGIDFDALCLSILDSSLERRHG
jgi:D-alanine-D-alanine ligase